MTDDERIKRAKRAETLLADPLMVEAKEHIEAECWRLFKQATPTDTEALQQIKGMQYMHGKYLAFLQSVIADGKMAQAEIERKKRGLRDRIQSAFS